MRKITGKMAMLLFAVLFESASLYAQEYDLVWSEEFNGTELNTSIWQYEVGTANNNELQYYTNRPQNIFVSDGKLTLKALKESYQGMNYTSARINSSGKFNFKYGKIEAYMKLSYGQGMWPAFWMLGQAFDQVGWPQCGEIDIMEQVGGVTANGKGDDVIHSTLHWGEIINGGHPMYGQAYQLDEGKFADGFHLVSTVWDKDQIRTYCDSNLFYTINVSGEDFASFEEKFYLILNLAVGGDWPGSPDATTVFPQTFEIDYIRLYKSKATSTIDGPLEVYPSDSSLQYSIFGAEDWTYEWLLPEGASFNGRTDSSTVNINWGCSAAELRCHVTSAIFDDTLSLNVALKEPMISGPLFFTPDETGMEFSFPALYATSYNWSVPSDASIVNGQNTPSILVDWGTSTDTVMLEMQNSCGTENYFQLLLPEGQYSYPDPFSPHSVPGLIVSTEYDYGGEGVAYHDADPGNQGPGPRQDEGVDTEYKDGGSNIGWVNSGEWTEYTIQVLESGTYSIDVRVATQNTSGISPLNIYFNDENRTGNMTVPSTGNWASFVTITAAPVSLYTTDTIMKLNFGGGGYNVGNVRISTYIEDASEELRLPESVSLFPNPSSGNVSIMTLIAITDIGIFDISGQETKHLSGHYTDTFELGTEDLPAGIYFIKTKTLDGSLHTLKFLKN